MIKQHIIKKLGKQKMPNYTVYLTKRAQKQLDLFSNTIAYPIITAISQLEFDPRPIGYKKLKGREAYRIRVGGAPENEEKS